MRQRSSEREVRKGLSRRDAIKVGASAVAFATPTLLLPRKARAAVRITFRDSGGPYTQAFAEAFYKPFNEAMKGEIEVVGVAGQHEPVSQIKAILDTKNYIWDGADVSVLAGQAATDAGYLEPLEIDDDPHVQQMPPQFRTRHLLGTNAFGTVLAYRTDKFKDRAPTGGWKDLWDVETFKGRRALRKHPFDTIEQALMADGVAPANVYPCDFDRAYRSLERIKPHVDVWWTGGAQSTQLLASGEVDLCATWSTRAQAAIDEKAPVGVSWNQGLYSYSGWVIIKGGPKVDACRKFIKFCANPERQAVYTRYLAAGPTNLQAYKHVDPARAALLATAPQNLEKMIAADPVFWGREQAKAVERFNSWLLK